MGFQCLYLVRPYFTTVQTFRIGVTAASSKDRWLLFCLARGVALVFWTGWRNPQEARGRGPSWPNVRGGVSCPSRCCRWRRPCASPFEATSGGALCIAVWNIASGLDPILVWALLILSRGWLGVHILLSDNRPQALKVASRPFRWDCRRGMMVVLAVWTLPTGHQPRSGHALLSFCPPLCARFSWKQHLEQDVAVMQRVHQFKRDVSSTTSGTNFEQ